MKRTLISFASLLTVLLLGCSDNHSSNVQYDTTPPFPPVGIVSISLDDGVELQWIDNQEPDLAGYNIYVGTSYQGKYSRIGSSTKPQFTDAGARNGVTYYYAVTAYDYSGNESDFSKDVVYDTPRPEGRNVRVWDRHVDKDRAGYDFSKYMVVNYDTDDADFYFEVSNSGVPFLVVWKDSDIEDMGYTRNLDEISVSPESGWSPTKDATAILHHTYVLRTFDNHYAKVRIVDITTNSIAFDWAYQIDPGNRELLLGHNRSVSKSVFRGDSGVRFRK